MSGVFNQLEYEIYAPRAHLRNCALIYYKYNEKSSALTFPKHWNTISLVPGSTDRDCNLCFSFESSCFHATVSQPAHCPCVSVSATHTHTHTDMLRVTAGLQDLLSWSKRSNITERCVGIQVYTNVSRLHRFWNQSLNSGRCTSHRRGWLTRTFGVHTVLAVWWLTVLARCGCRVLRSRRCWLHAPVVSENQGKAGLSRRVEAKREWRSVCM